jgi:hypothetical protein
MAGKAIERNISKRPLSFLCETVAPGAFAVKLTLALMSHKKYKYLFLLFYLHKSRAELPGGLALEVQEC